MIHLITSFYIEKRKSENVERKSENVIEIQRLKNEINKLKGIPVKKKTKGHSTIERNAELQRCLMYNLKSIYISTIHLFVEDEGAAKKAMEIADEANVRRLILTHFSQRLKDKDVLEWYWNGKSCIVFDEKIKI